jgi:flagellar hook assembly protein FlgD
VNSTTNITLGDGTILTWDGRSDTGQIVSTGQYFVEVRTNDGQGSDATVTREVTVIHGALTIGDGQVLVYPNPLSVRVDGKQFTFATSGNPPVTLNVQIYTTAGELVDTVASQPGASQLVWYFSGKVIASGLYLAVVEVTDPVGGMQRQIKKLAIFH